MSRLLEELINSLGTVLIRYHDFQKNVIVCVKESDQKSAAFKKAAREYAIKLLQADGFEQEFGKLNIECTKDYKQRLDFLDFIKNELTILKKLLAQEIPFSASALDEYKQKIALLFIDLKQLLNVKKSASHQVQDRRLNGTPLTTIALNGFIDEGYSSYINGPICFSGILIKEELLNRFNMLATTTDEEIIELAAGLCEEHQNALLAAKLIKIESQLSEVQATLEKTQLKLKDTQSTLEDTQSRLKEQQLKIEALETKLAIKELELSKTMEKAVDLQKIIDQQNLQLEEKATLITPISEQTPEETSITTRQVIPNTPFSHIIYPSFFRNTGALGLQHVPFFFHHQSVPRITSTTQVEPPTSSVDGAKKNPLGTNFGSSTDL